jgi:hypothetical protein
MNYKQLTGSAVCGVVMSALAVAPALAQNDTMMTGTVTPDTNMTTTAAADASLAPMPINGQVLRYYTDRSGFVTAMDVQTADGVRLLRFAPDLGQRLYTTYPIGGTVDVYVVGSPYMGDTRYDVVSIGKEVPRAGYMQPYMVRDVDLLEADPYIEIGAQQKNVTGKLQRVITNEKGDVLGLVLDNNTLVRVPREARSIAPGYAGTSRITPLFKGASVVATGYDEAPRFGVISVYPERLAARAIVVNGRSVGGVGFPRFDTTSKEVLLNTNIMGPDTSADELKAVGMGYNSYPGNMSSASAMTGTTDTNLTTGTAGTAATTGNQ